MPPQAWKLSGPVPLSMLEIFDKRGLTGKRATSRQRYSPLRQSYHGIAPFQARLSQHAATKQTAPSARRSVINLRRLHEHEQRRSRRSTPSPSCRQLAPLFRSQTTQTWIHHQDQARGGLREVRTRATGGTPFRPILSQTISPVRWQDPLLVRLQHDICDTADQSRARRINLDDR